MAISEVLGSCHVAVVGSRTFNNHKRIFSVLDSVRKRLSELVIVSGACPSGPDYWAERWARKHGVEMRLFPADWSKGRGAGLARNQKIVDAADRVIAFWDGQSSGSLNSIEKTLAAGKPLFLLTERNPRLVQVYDVEQVKEHAGGLADAVIPARSPSDGSDSQ
jgi:hypothetical protein